MLIKLPYDRGFEGLQNYILLLHQEISRFLIA